jgi:hypothetical protein
MSVIADKAEKMAAQAALIRKHVFNERRAASAVVVVNAPLESKPATNGAIKKPNSSNYMSYAEIERITSIPVSGQMDEMELEEFSRANILAEAYNDGFRFFPEQAEAISAYEMVDGGFFVVPVGFGKTLASLVIADKAYRKGIERMTLHVPSQVVSQLTLTDIRWARTKTPLSVPIHVLAGKPRKQREMLARSGKRGLYIMPYSLLSAQDAEETLWAIEPGLVILDEGHNVARRSSSARAKRMTNYLEKTRCECVVLSGTITAKSVMDYWHLIKQALKDNNPLPNSAHLANEWGGIIDAQAEGDQPVTTDSAGPMMPLVHWARKWFGHEEQFDESVAGFRRAYKRRLRSTAGVVASDREIGTSLILKNEPIEGYKQAEGWDELDKLIRKVEEQWITPNGDEIEHAIHTWKWLNELTAGFYNELTWPAAEQYAERKSISLVQAQDVLEEAKQCHAEGQQYLRMLRKFLEGSYPEKPGPGLDTMMLVGNDMARHGDDNVPSEMYEQWCLWKAMDFEGRPDRDSRAVRVCPYKINAAVEWSKKFRHDGGIIWYEHQDVGLWLYESLREAGVDAFHCPAGKKHNKKIRELGDPNEGGTGNYVVVASIRAHGEGKNLQAFQRSFFVQWPRDSKKAEQALGRIHREGQKADEVIEYTCLTTEFDHLNFAACLNDSLYAQQTTGNRKKIIYATYDPQPKIFPSAVLLERGLQVKRLNEKQQKEMKERFAAT